MRQPSALFAVTAYALELSLAGVAGAQTISMTPAPTTPELHGPFLWAARPGTPLLFTIPATGQAPLSFAAPGLPMGLTIAAATGTITGTTPAAGSYPVRLPLVRQRADDRRERPLDPVSHEVALVGKWRGPQSCRRTKSTPWASASVSTSCGGFRASR